MAAEQRTAVLVIRAWVEETLEERTLRARITHTVDIESTATVETAVASEAEILRTVQEWLLAFVDRR